MLSHFTKFPIKANEKQSKKLSLNRKMKNIIVANMHKVEKVRDYFVNAGVTPRQTDMVS